MSNSYYTVSASIARYSLARAEHIASQLAAIEAGFALLPEPADITGNMLTFVGDATSPGANAYAVTMDPAPLSYVLGMHLSLKVPATNAAGACTVNVNALGAKQIVRADGSVPRAGDLASGRIVELRYDGVAFQLVSSLSTESTDAAAAATAAAQSATNALAYATAADGSKTAAAGSATSAATSATNANTYATSADVSREAAAISQTAAGNSATNAATSASEALGYRNTASTHATTATTKAGEASTSATNAAGSATTASGHAGTATTKAGEAATSATNAATSAAQAATAAARVPAPTIAGSFVQAKADLSGYEEVGAPIGNPFINPLMDIWTRGASLPTGIGTVAYVADRFFAYLQGAGLTVFRSGGGILGTQTIPFCLGANGATGNTGCAIGQRIESVNAAAFANKRVTFSCWVYNSHARTVTVSGYHCTGSPDNHGGARAAPFVPAGKACAVGWNLITHSFDAPDLVQWGMEVNIEFGAVTAGQTVATTGWNLSLGNVAGPLQRRPVGHELALCQRFYQYHPDMLIQGYNGAGGGIFNDFMLPVAMRAAPTVGITGAGTSNAGAVTVNNALADHVRLTTVVTAAGYGYSIAHLALNSEL